MSIDSKDELSAPLRAAASMPVPKIGIVVGYDQERGLLVEVPGAGLGPQVVRSTIALDARAVEAAVRERRSAVLVFEDGQPEKPIMIGLVEPVNPTPMIDLVLEPASSESSEPPPSLEAKIDGKRVVLEADDEIELRCGDASITLRRNGRVVIRGAYVETHAQGVNRIKGGSVAIN